jgi:hypothetical protein
MGPGAFIIAISALSRKPPPYFNMSRTICNLLYVQADAGIKACGSTPDYQEKLITIMELSPSRVPEDRIAVLEQEIKDMEALVKGLIAELLDIKAVTRITSRETEERNRQERKWGPIMQATTLPEPADPSPFVSVHCDGKTVIRPRGTSQPDLPVAPAEPEMVRIMQTDGTMKLEPRYGETKHIDSSGGYGRNRKNASESQQSPLIYAAEKEKSDSA